MFTSSTVIVGDGVGDPCQECDRNLGRLLFSARSLAMVNSSLFFETDTNLSMASLCLRHSSHYFPFLHRMYAPVTKLSLPQSPIELPCAHSSITRVVFSRYRDTEQQPWKTMILSASSFWNQCYGPHRSDVRELCVSKKKRHTINPIQRSQLDSRASVKRLSQCLHVNGWWSLQLHVSSDPLLQEAPSQPHLRHTANITFCVYGSVHRCSILITVQRDATKKQSIYYSASSLYMFRVSTTPIIRKTQNCNHILRYWS